MAIVCINRPNRTKKRIFTCVDANRIVRNIRERDITACNDAQLSAAILHGFGLQDVFCYFARALSIFSRLKVFIIILYAFKVVKAVLVLYNTMTRGVRRVIRAKVFSVLEIDLTSGMLAKMAVWGVELSAALDVLIGAMVLIIALVEKASGTASFLDAVCGYVGTFQTSVRVAEIAAVLLDETSLLELKELEGAINGVQSTLTDIMSATGGNE